METAPCIHIDDVHVIVICPYCFKTHKHGSGVLGPRMSHCGVGEYLIGMPMTDTAVHQAIKQHKAKISALRRRAPANPSSAPEVSTAPAHL